MGYELNALFGKTETLKQIQFPPKDIKLATLRQRFTLLPLPKYDEEEGDYEGFSRIYFETDEDIHMLECGLIPKRIYNQVLQLSKVDKIAFLYADTFGGVGEQYAVVWEHGKILKEYPTTWNDNPHTWVHMPINQALKVMGVIREGKYDEFDTMQLGKYRDTFGWYQHGTNES